MKHRQIDYGNGKVIDIYDDIFDFSQIYQMMDFAKTSNYKVDRLAPTIIPVTQQFTTLKSEYSIYDLLRLEFFKGKSTENIKQRLIDAELRLRRVYVNLSTAQDVYHYHCDSDINEDITLLYYFNPVWEPNWEGETHFGDEKAKEIIHSVSFIPGRVVTFSGSIPHKSSSPAFFAPEFRYVLTIKFHSKAHASYQNSFPITDLFIDGNIEVSQTEQLAIDFLKDITRGVSHSGITFFQHCCNVYKILKLQHQPEHICMAGLFHSVYGTEFFNGIKFDDRGMIKAIIGERAEELVFRFCNLYNRDKQLLDPAWADSEVVLLSYANLLDGISRGKVDTELVIAYKNKLDSYKEQQ